MMETEPLHKSDTIRIGPPDATLRRRRFHTVDIWVSDDDARWADIARRLYGGGLGGLLKVKRSAQAAVHYTEALPIPGGYYIKRFFMRDRLDTITHLFRPARAFRELQGCRLAAAAGIRVPEVCCVLILRRGGLVRESAMISAAVDGFTAFPGFYQDNCLSAAAREPGMPARLMAALADETAKWHRLNLCHGEMHLGNVLCREHNNRFDFAWVDNERTGRFRGTSHQERNLAELNKWKAVLPADRMAFWQQYCRALDIRGTTRQSLLKQVLRKTRHKQCQDLAARIPA